MLRRIAVVIVSVLSVASQAVAQDQWGVDVALTPSWQSGPGVKQLFSADDVDLQGSAMRIGFVRGMDLGGDWGSHWSTPRLPRIPRSISTWRRAIGATAARFCERSAEPT